MITDDMPSGWAEDLSGAFDDDDGTDDDERCESGAEPPLEILGSDVPQASVAFTSGMFDVVNETILRAESDDDAAAAIDVFRQAIADCPVTVNGDGETFSMSEMSFPDRAATALPSWGEQTRFRSTLRSW